MAPTNLSQITFTLVTLLTLVSAKHITTHDIQERQTSTLESTYPVTGVLSSVIQPRLEIRQLATDYPDIFNVYLLGLQRFQQVNQSDPLSWYSIAGIHGRPYVPWDGVQAGPNLPGYPGYCHHVSNLLLPWHRPYLVLFEQVLFQHINDAANDFPDGEMRERYTAAASTWRAPFWDWAMPPPQNESSFPDVLTSPTINVTTPNGMTEIDNPLYSYKFHPVSQQDFYWQPFILWNETLRAPNSHAANATSQEALIASMLNNARPNIMNRVYNLLANYDNFTQFETYAWQSSGGQSVDSLESVHDLIHGMTGGDGHMSYLDYSAFDPLFMLHHAMVDRLFAIYQALHPDTYVESMQAVEQTFTTRLYARLNADSPLAPFHSNAVGTNWTSQRARSIEQFGYTYPELAGNASIASIRMAVNTLYGDRASMQTGPPSVVTRDDSDITPTRAYTADITSQKFAVNGSYAIYIFLGNVSDSADASASWPLAPNLVGTHGIFTGKTRPSRVEDDGPQSFEVGPNVKVTGSVPLTAALVGRVQRGELADMQESTVRPFLQKELHWRIAKFDGTPIDGGDLADFSITIASADVQPAASPDEFPVWSNFKTLDVLY